MDKKSITLHQLSNALRYQLWKQLQEHKPQLAKYISMPQSKLNHTSSLMARLRTGHARTNHWLHRIKIIPPTPCRMCGLEDETITHLLVICPHPMAIKARKQSFYKIEGLIQSTPEEQLEFLLTRAPPPQMQQVKEKHLLGYLQAINIPI
jgi:hypothetical protein